MTSFLEGANPLGPVVQVGIGSLTTAMGGAYEFRVDRPARIEAMSFELGHGVDLLGPSVVRLFRNDQLEAAFGMQPVTQEGSIPIGLLGAWANLQPGDRMRLVTTVPCVFRVTVRAVTPVEEGSFTDFQIRLADLGVSETAPPPLRPRRRNSDTRGDFRFDARTLVEAARAPSHRTGIVLHTTGARRRP